MIAAFIVLLLFPLAQADTGGATAAAQAGKVLWEGPNTACRNCHGNKGEGGYGPDLAGQGKPALVGDEFISNWQGQTLLDLKNKLTSMPPDNAGKMTAQEYVDIMTLLLQTNRYPAGKSELSTDPEVLRQIKIEP